MSLATKNSRWSSNKIPYELKANITDIMRIEIKKA